METIKAMKDGAILANSGHFNVEIDVASLERNASSKKEIRKNLVEYKIKKKLVFLLGEGRLVNLACAEGHPAEVMDMSFANQALAAQYFVDNKGRLKPEVFVLPKKIDQQVAGLKIKAMGIDIDKLTQKQKRYLSSWEEGT